MSEQVYPAKYDWWLLLILAAASLGLIAWGISDWPDKRGEGAVLVGAGLFNTLLFSLLLYPCRYTISDTEVLIRCGILRSRVAIAAIRSVTATSNPLSAPAPSLRRVSIQLDNGSYVLVSPLNREGFIRELSARIENIT